MKKLLIILLVLSACGKVDHLQESELIQEREMKQPTQKAATVQDITGTWVYSFETNPIHNGQYAHHTIELRAIEGDRLIINNRDTLCLQTSASYAGCQMFNRLQSGFVKGGTLTHCELYADPISQMSYYVCAEYSR